MVNFGRGFIFLVSKYQPTTFLGLRQNYPRKGLGTIQIFSLPGIKLKLNDSPRVMNTAVHLNDDYPKYSKGYSTYCRGCNTGYVFIWSVFQTNRA